MRPSAFHSIPSLASSILIHNYRCTPIQQPRASADLWTTSNAYEQPEGRVDLAHELLPLVFAPSPFALQDVVLLGCDLSSGIFTRLPR